MYSHAIMSSALSAAGPLCCLSCRADLMIKKLRYYARFIVVCLLVRKIKLVRDLARVS